MTPGETSRDSRRIDWDEVKRVLRSAEEALVSGVDRDRIRRVYRERAAKLARPESEESAAQSLPILRFRLGQERYALELSEVAEVMPFSRCTPVPGNAREHLGVVNRRGDILSVIDLASLFGRTEAATGSSGSVLILRRLEFEAGIRVDDVDGVGSLSADQLLKPKDSGFSVPLEFVRGWSEDGITLLDAAAIEKHILRPGDKNSPQK